MTTAVGFRRGDTNDNNSFAGVTGEIVADLGNGGNIDDGKATVVLHRGDGIAGGIRMAREDLANLTDQSLYNLATYQSTQPGVTAIMFNDLRNLQHCEYQQYRTSTEHWLKFDYNIASKDGHDLSTTIITNPEYSVDGVPGGGPVVANASITNLDGVGTGNVRDLAFVYWLNNVNTDFLAGDDSYRYASTNTYDPSMSQWQLHGTPLARTNMNNINTSVLANGRSNVDGDKNLAYADLQNVGYSTIVSYLDSAYSVGNVKLQNYEWIDRKKTSIDEYSSTQEIDYPSVKALISYSELIGRQYTNIKLDNVDNWKIATEPNNLNKLFVTIDDGGSNYAVSSTISTNIGHPDDPNGVVILITKVDNTGKILEATVPDSQLYASSPIVTVQPYQDPVGGAIVTVTTQRVNSGKLLKIDLTNSDIKNTTDTQKASIKYEFEETSHGSGIITNINSVMQQMSNSSTHSSGAISLNNNVSEIEAKMASATSGNKAVATQTSGTSLTDVSVALSTFETQESIAGNYIFTYDGTDWSLASSTVNIADYGITFTGTPVADDAITVVYTVETPLNVSSITVTKTSAYLNKNEPLANESLDYNHELLNRSEIVSYVGGEIQQAIQTVISTAVVFKGIVADETYLPSTTATANGTQTAGGTSLGTISVTLSTFETQITTSGDYVFVYDGTDWNYNSAVVDLNNYGISFTGSAVLNDEITVAYRAAVSQAPTNGDLYWITAFSSNPPAGMLAGRSGSAIWNTNITPAGWSYETDNQNIPDNTTLKYTTTATAQVLSVKLAGTHNSKPNALVVESDGLYVKTPVETPELPVLPNNGDTGVYHLYAVNNNGTMVYSWVNDALLQVTQNV